MLSAQLSSSLLNSRTECVVFGECILLAVYSASASRSCTSRLRPHHPSSAICQVLLITFSFSLIWPIYVYIKHKNLPRRIHRAALAISLPPNHKPAGATHFMYSAGEGVCMGRNIIYWLGVLIWNCLVSQTLGIDCVKQFKMSRNCVSTDDDGTMRERSLYMRSLAMGGGRVRGFRGA